MNLLEKLTSIDKNKIKRQDLLEQLEGVIFEYDEKDHDSVDNAQLILDILTDLYPDILISENKKVKEKNQEPEQNERPEEKKNSEEKEIANKEKEEIKKSEKKSEETVAIEKKEKSEEKMTEKKKITIENSADCHNVVNEIQTVLNKYKSSKPKEPRKKKPLAVIVKDSVVSIIKRVVHKEVIRNPKKEINEEEFEEVVKSGKLFLKSIRKFSGGVNEQVISSFEKQMHEILEMMSKRKAA